MHRADLRVSLHLFTCTTFMCHYAYACQNVYSCTLLRPAGLEAIVISKTYQYRNIFQMQRDVGIAVLECHTNNRYNYGGSVQATQGIQRLYHPCLFFSKRDVYLSSAMRYNISALCIQAKKEQNVWMGLLVYSLCKLCVGCTLPSNLCGF